MDGRTDGQSDGQTDRPTDGLTNRRTDQRTDKVSFCFWQLKIQINTGVKNIGERKKMEEKECERAY